MDTVQKLFRFLDESPTCYHAAANGVYAMSAVTALTAQNTTGVKRLMVKR